MPTPCSNTSRKLCDYFLQQRHLLDVEMIICLHQAANDFKLKSFAAWCRQIITPALHHSNFTDQVFLLTDAQQLATKSVKVAY